MERICLFVICAAPLARRAPDIAQALVDAGWTVHPVATPSAAEGWFDTDAVREITGNEVRSTYRAPTQPKTRQSPDAVLVCPATFNTIGKLANGLADSYALSALSEALGARVPMTVVPMINDRLWGHPALAVNIEVLSSVGVRILDVSTLEPKATAVMTGRGAAITEAFPADRLVAVVSASLR